jgi:glycogen(starch) synthase
MKVLLIGPYPPPHGGVSVHVAALKAELREAGARCRVLDLVPQADAPPPRGPAAPDGNATERIRGGWDLVRTVFRHARAGWTVHLHTNGHNLKSWLIVAACGAAARPAPASLVTLHSGMLPAYLRKGPRRCRLLARIACSLFSWTLCVNREIESTLATIGVPSSRLRLLPAFLPPRVRSGLLPPEIERWMGCHQPILSTTVFFRSEYGLDLLTEAVARLRRQHPRLGLLVMGSGDQSEPRALLRRRGLHGAALLAGDLDHDECVKAIARSDVFVRATRADGDSISVREAAALGVPTVASQVGTRPEGLYLFPPGNVDGLVGAISGALRQRRPLAVSGGEDTMRRLLALYAQEDEGAQHRPRPEWTPDLGRNFSRTIGTMAYARTDHRD